MRILNRYIFREVFSSWLAVTGVLLIVLLTNQVARVLSRAAEAQFPRDVILQLVGLGVLQNLTVLVPVGLLLGVVLALGRLYHDSEMIAAQSCGARPWRIYVPVLVFAAVVTLALTWITLDLAPAAARRVLSMRGEAAQAGQFAAVAPGRFRSFGGGGAVVYAQGGSASGELLRVFVKRNVGERVEVAVAARATHVLSADGRVHTMTLYDGARYEGIPGSNVFRVVRFRENVIPVRVPQINFGTSDAETLPTRELLRSSDPERRAEWHWRLGLPSMALVLTVLAIPLSRLRPRQGRYARVGQAILVYFLYFSLMSAGQVWIARRTMPEVLGLWWVHLVVAAFALLLIAVPGWLARLRYRSTAVAA